MGCFNKHILTFKTGIQKATPGFSDTRLLIHIKMLSLQRFQELYSKVLSNFLGNP